MNKKQLQAIAAFRSTEMSRYALDALNVTDKGVLEATDGKIAGRLTIEGETFGHGGLIDAATVDATIKSMGAKDTAVLNLNGKVSITVAGRETTANYAEGQFPDLSACFPTDPPVLRVALSATLLKTLAEAVLKLNDGGNHQAITLEFVDGERPVRFSAGNPGIWSLTGVVMPMNLG